MRLLRQRLLGKRLGILLLAAGASVGCGHDLTGPTLASHATAATALALGSRFTCALTDESKPFCWGDGLSGQLGDSSFVPKLAPSASAGAHSYVAIAAGDQTTCALDRAGAAWCWGDDPAQAGIRLSFRNVPTVVSAPRALVSITVGRKFACGLDDAGNAYCWGENGRGQLGAGDTVAHQSPTRVQGTVRFTTISAGFWHVCAVATTGSAYCWGDNAFGELSAGDTVSSSRPRQIAGNSVFRSIMSGSIHSCGITTSDAALCWGANFSGQLGDGTGTSKLAATPVVAPGLTFSTMHASRGNSVFSHTCALTTGGDVYCWGYNSKSQLGSAATGDPCDPTRVGVSNPNVTTVCSYKPTKVSGVSGVTALDTGAEHTCALTSTAQLFCWGDNTYGELGDGTGVNQATPVLVKGGLRFP